jgi:hypothetical protein
MPCSLKQRGKKRNSTLHNRKFKNPHKVRRWEERGSLLVRKLLN